MAIRPPVGVGSVLPRTGPSFARARLALAKRAGYLPPEYNIAGGPQAIGQWRDVSKNLSASARTAGFSNPLQWLRQGATSGTLPNLQKPMQPPRPTPADPHMLALLQVMRNR